MFGKLYRALQHNPMYFGTKNNILLQQMNAYFYVIDISYKTNYTLKVTITKEDISDR